MALTPVIIFAEAELCWSLISATVPNLKNFMKSFNTGFGHDFAFSTLDESGHRRGSQYVFGSRSEIRLSNINRRSKISKKGDQFDGLGPRNDYDIAVSGGLHEVHSESAGEGSSLCRDFGIRKDVEMRIENSRYSGGSSNLLL